MKIVVINEFVSSPGKPMIGGPEAREVNLFKRFNHDVHFVCAMLRGSKREEEKEGIKIHRVGNPRGYAQRGNMLTRYFFYREAVKRTIELEPDLVMASGFAGLKPAKEAAKKIGVPAVATVHEVWKGEWKKNMGLLNGAIGEYLEPRFLRDFDLYIAVSNFTKEKLLSLVPNAKVEVVYNGVDLKKFKKVKGKKFNKKTLITVCRLVGYKRVNDLIKALDLIRKKHDVQLKIVGSGPEEKKLRELAEKLELSKNVDFAGKIKRHTDLLSMVKGADLFVLPSVTEGFSIVTVEAMALGTPFVVADIPPVKEASGGRGGLFFEPKHVGDLAVKIMQVLEGKAKIKKTGNFLKKYNWEKLARQEEKIFEKLVREKNED